MIAFGVPSFQKMVSPEKSVITSGPIQPAQRAEKSHRASGRRSPRRPRAGDCGPGVWPGPSGMGGTSRSRNGVRAGSR
ncbi:hypothetical protein ACFQZC_16090 [Streptacidiphilus monticola]